MKRFGVGCLVALSLLQAGGGTLRPPSVPIVACDPYFSVWSPSVRPNGSDTTTWYGARQPIRVSVELDGVRYRLMGAKGLQSEADRQADLAALKCTDCRVRPLTTVFTYADGRRTVELSFLTPKIADDLDVFSRPVTYATVRTTGAEKVRVFAEIGSELATNDDGVEMVTNRLTVAGLSAVAIGRKEQRPLSKTGDQVRCDWGFAYLVNPEADGPDVHFLLAYDDVETLQFLGRTVPAWWRRGGTSFVKMLEEAEADYPRLRRESAGFDARWERDLEAVGGRKYRELACLAYRQSFAACKLVAGPGGQPLYFSKENSSNGCIGTVDVFYPQLPLLLLTSKTLVRATLEPILLYATGGQWPFAYAPHDVGRWPLANGQVYNFGKGYKDKQGNPTPDSTRMPVEECGNMLISLCALSEAEGNAAFAGRYWDTIAGWARYLETFGFDPGDQLCTDDFAGHLAHNANLSLKTIMAFAAMARMVERLGKAETAQKYRKLAEESVPKWIAAAEGGAEGGFRLAFDRPDSWSQKYNLVWDRVLGFGLFPPEVATRELEAYRKLALPFGIALDSRKPYTKLDWEFWSASLTGRREDLDFVTDLVWRYADETPDRLPLPDWYWANNGRVRGFWARPVIGGVFMPMLANRNVLKPVRVKVDFSAETGPVKPVNGVGQPPMVGGPGNFGMFRYLKEAGVPYSRLHDVGGAYGQMRYVDIPNIFRNFDADETDPANYDFAYTDDLLKAMNANGVEPFFRLGVTIENAVERGFPGYRCDPPKDYAKWARICEQVIAHYTEGWANGFLWNIEYWEIWNEPDNNPIEAMNPLFRAPWSEFLRFYGTVAPYLKTRFPKLKIGGYASCGFYAAVGAGQVRAANSSPRLEYFVTCAKEFLAAAKAKEWPLDFFSYHSYSEPEEALRQVRYADELLNEYGFTREKTERIFNEWLPYVSHENLGTARQAAGIAAELIGLQDGPCDLACIYDARCGIGNYSPLFNAMTYRPHKAYYAFTAFNELRRCGQAVKTEVVGEAPGLWATAAVGERGAAVLVANDSDNPLPIDFDFGGRSPASVRLTDENRTDAVVELPAVLPPRAFAVIVFDSRTDETEAIQKRIDAAHAAGGGRVSLGKGVHLVRTLRLKSDVELHLEAGAELRGSRDSEEYVADLFGWKGNPYARNRRMCAMIRILGERNVKVTGEPGSLINGRNCFDIRNEEGYRGPHAIVVFDSTNLTFSGFSVRDAGNFALYANGVADVRVEDLTIRGGHDGLDFFDSRNVSVSDCSIRSGDDCVAGHGNRDLTVRDCELNTACNVFRLGGNGILVENCRAGSVGEFPHRWSLPFALRKLEKTPPGQGRRDTLSCFTFFTGRRVATESDDIVFRNCTFAGARQFVHYNLSGNEQWQNGKGLKGLVFENVTVEGLEMPSSVYSVPDAPLTLTLKDCRFFFKTSVDAFARGAHVAKIVADDVEVKGMTGPILRSWAGSPVLSCDDLEGVSSVVEQGTGDFAEGAL